MAPYDYDDEQDRFTEVDFAAVDAWSSQRLELGKAHFDLWDAECLDDSATCPADGRAGMPVEVPAASPIALYRCVHCEDVFQIPRREA